MRYQIRAAFVLLFIATAAYAAPVHLRCEYLQNPLGIDAPAPHFSWQSDSQERNWLQAAYQILVATDPERLQAGSADVWDSGKVKSSESVGIIYSGPKLAAHARYFWSVRVWDTKEKDAQSTESVWWETGLLSQNGWNAQWIAWKNPDEDADRANIRWILPAGQDSSGKNKKTVSQFRIEANLSEKPRNATLFLLSHGTFVARVNGKQVGTKTDWHQFAREDATQQFVAGKNLIEVTVTAAEPNSFNPEAESKTFRTALAGLLKVTRADGTDLRIATTETWQAKPSKDPAWHAAKVVGELTDKKFGDVLPGPLPQPAAYLRHEFALSKTVKSARLYATALGSYRIFLNGTRIGQDVLTPDFTEYSKRVLYQTYDVTSQLAAGHNSIAAVLGDGWFASSLTWRGWSFFFLPPPTRLLAQLEIEYTDGTHDTIGTDESWKTAPSPILFSQIYDGEFYDARLDSPGWNRPGFDDSNWSAAVLAPANVPVTSQPIPPVHVASTIAPVGVTPVSNGAYVFDMGQNMVGWAKLKASGAAGTSIRLRFAEILNSDGTIYRDNLRNADATDVFVLSGKGEETYTPYFTFHGFRYVEVTGYPGVPTTASLTGEVLNSLSGEPTGTLTTSSALINHMWSIGLWGQRGNFLSIPTDCPQRDERLGWMGDAGVFWRTGSYNFGIQAFTHKFMNDVTDAQTSAGAFTNVSPDILRPDGSEGAPGWGDAGVIIPWNTWLQYGDTSIIRENWDAMQRWMDFIARANPNFLRKNGVGPNFADWLAPDENTPKDLLATAYWALIADMMADMAHAIGNEPEAQKYRSVVANIRKAYQAAYIKANGEVQGGTQTAYVVTLYTKLAPASLEEAMTKNLVKDIESRKWHLSTGFLGTPFLLFTLADHGRTDVAYRLLLNDTYPSWGYMLSKGATTWWERWNGDTGDPAMNSYNHYAFGSVIAWVYRYAAGIDTDSTGAGFRNILIHPRPEARMTHARGEYDSVYGRIVSDWTTTPEGHFSLDLTIPANATANVLLPASSGTHVTQDGQTVNPPQEAGSYLVHLGSGIYRLEVK